MIAALALIADLAGLICLFLSHLPLGLKAVVAIALVAVPFGSLTYFAGRKQQWKEGAAYIHELEKEVGALQREFSGGRARARRAA